MSTHFAIPDLEAEKREEAMRLLKCENDTLRAENAKLREALKKIAELVKLPENANYEKLTNTGYEIFKLAKGVLNGKDI